MPQCDFFAVGDDFTPILDFVFSQPGWVLVESASRHDLPLRRFASTADVLAAFDLERGMTHLLLHAPECGGTIREKEITFNPGYARQSGATGRTDAAGWGLIQLFLEPGSTARIGVSFSNCFSESSARAREFVSGGDLGPVDDWDMTEVRRVSERLNRRIRQLGVWKQGSAAVLPRAAEIAAAGTATLGGPRRDIA